METVEKTSDNCNGKGIILLETPPPRIRAHASQTYFYLPS
ncbi:hypothetical protein GCM10027395_25550 [Giesbergeria sinuosa]